MGSRRTRGDRRKFPVKVTITHKDTKLTDYINPYLQPIDSKWRVYAR